MQKVAKPSLFFTDKSNIRLGFEIECYIKEKHKDEFQKQISDLNKEVIFDDDESIELPDSYCGNSACYGYGYDGGVTFELQTPVLPPKSAMKLLSGIFEVLQKYGGTNHSCGLHLNISSTDKNRMKNFDPFPFTHSPIWSKLLKDFRREGNDYCNHNYDVRETPMQYLERLADSYGGDEDFTDKYNCVNLSNWSGGNQSHSRIEIRGMGNEKYHYRYNTIAKYANRIIKLFILSCEQRKLRV